MRPENLIFDMPHVDNQKTKTMHGLRNVFASTLASNGVDLYTLQALLTHGNSAMNQRYAHLANKHLRDAANVANKLGQKKEEG